MNGKQFRYCCTSWYKACPIIIDWFREKVKVTIRYLGLSNQTPMWIWNILTRDIRNSKDCLLLLRGSRVKHARFEDGQDFLDNSKSNVVKYFLHSCLIYNNQPIFARKSRLRLSIQDYRISASPKPDSKSYNRLGLVNFPTK